MIEKMIEEVKKQLPLKINALTWINSKFQMHGPTWNFEGLCAWRISSEKEIDFACFDERAKSSLESLKDLEIIDINFQCRELKIDPVFKLSNGQRIEIFSILCHKSWTLCLGNLPIFIASPGEPEVFNNKH